MVAFQSGALWFVSDFLNKALAFPLLYLLIYISAVKSGRNQPKLAMATDFLRSLHVKNGFNKVVGWRNVFLLAGKEVWWVGVWQGLHLECLHTNLIGMQKSNIILIIGPGWVFTSQGKDNFQVPVSTQLLSPHLRADFWHQQKPLPFPPLESQNTLSWKGLKRASWSPGPGSAQDMH